MQLGILRFIQMDSKVDLEPNRGIEKATAQSNKIRSALKINQGKIMNTTREESMGVTAM
jgi:hypothetical protein